MNLYITQKQLKQVEKGKIVTLKRNGDTVKLALKAVAKNNPLEKIDLQIEALMAKRKGIAISEGKKKARIQAE